MKAGEYLENEVVNFMKFNILRNIAIVSYSILISGICLAFDAGEAKECKNIVMTETDEFSGLPMAAFSMAQRENEKGIGWHINWDGETANGICLYGNGGFREIRIYNNLQHHSKHQKSDTYSGKYGGFYYDRHIGEWRDPDGETCHTCTPENGFPARGGH